MHSNFLFMKHKTKIKVLLLNDDSNVSYKLYHVKSQNILFK